FLPLKIPGIGILRIDKTQKRNLVKGQIIIDLQALIVLVGNAHIKESVPNANGVVLNIPFLNVVSDDAVVGRIKDKIQGFGQFIIDGILPIESIIALVKSRQSQSILGKVDLTEFLFVILPQDVSAGRNTGRQWIKIKVLEQLEVGIIQKAHIFKRLYIQIGKRIIISGPHIDILAQAVFNLKIPMVYLIIGSGERKIFDINGQRGFVGGPSFVQPNDT